MCTSPPAARAKTEQTSRERGLLLPLPAGHATAAPAARRGGRARDGTQDKVEVLTTLSMEEADVLGDRIGIMAAPKRQKNMLDMLESSFFSRADSRRGRPRGSATGGSTAGTGTVAGLRTLEACGPERHPPPPLETRAPDTVSESF